MSPHTPQEALDLRFRPQMPCLMNTGSFPSPNFSLSSVLCPPTGRNLKWITSDRIRPHEYRQFSKFPFSHSILFSPTGAILCDPLQSPDIGTPWVQSLVAPMWSPMASAMPPAMPSAIASATSTVILSAIPSTLCSGIPQVLKGHSPSHMQGIIEESRGLHNAILCGPLWPPLCVMDEWPSRSWGITEGTADSLCHPLCDPKGTEGPLIHHTHTHTQGITLCYLLWSSDLLSVSVLGEWPFRSWGIAEGIHCNVQTPVMPCALMWSLAVFVKMLSKPTSASTTFVIVNGLKTIKIGPYWTQDLLLQRPVLYY